jgi:hypothetical protein
MPYTSTAWDWKLLITINDATNNVTRNIYLDRTLNGITADGDTYMTNGSNQKVVTNIVVHKGEQINVQYVDAKYKPYATWSCPRSRKFTDRNNIEIPLWTICEYPHEGPGWVAVNWDSPNIGFQAGDITSVSNLKTFYQANNLNPQNEAIQPVALTFWGDTDHGGKFTDYYDFNDALVLFAISPYAAPTTDCDNTKIIMSANPTSQVNNGSIQFQAFNNTPGYNMTFDNLQFNLNDIVPVEPNNVNTPCSGVTASSANCVVSAPAGQTYHWRVNYHTNTATCSKDSTFNITDQTWPKHSGPC